MIATRQQTDGKNSGCLWKLFDDEGEFEYLKYKFKYKPDLNLNIKLEVFDAAQQGYVRNFATENGFSGGKEFTVKRLDYNSSEVYLLANVENIHGHSFRLDFDFVHSPKSPLSGGAIFTIIFFTMIFLAAGALAALLWLNMHGHINIYIPKKWRVLCLKDYKTEEEKACEEHDEALGQRIGQNRELNLRLAV